MGRVDRVEAPLKEQRGPTLTSFASMAQSKNTVYNINIFHHCLAKGHCVSLVKALACLVWYVACLETASSKQWAPFPLALHDGKLQMALRLLWLCWGWREGGGGGTKIGADAVTKAWIYGCPIGGRNSAHQPIALKSIPMEPFVLYWWKCYP